MLAYTSFRLTVADVSYRQFVLHDEPGSRHSVARSGKETLPQRVTGASGSPVFRLANLSPGPMDLALAGVCARGHSRLDQIRGDRQAPGKLASMNCPTATFPSTHSRFIHPDGSNLRVTRTRVRAIASTAKARGGEPQPAPPRRQEPVLCLPAAKLALRWRQGACAAAIVSRSVALRRSHSSNCRGYFCLADSISKPRFSSGEVHALGQIHSRKPKPILVTEAAVVDLLHRRTGL